MVTNNQSALAGIIIGALMSGLVQFFLEIYRSTQARRQLKVNMLLKLVEARLACYQQLYPHLSKFIKDANFTLDFGKAPLSKSEVNDFLSIINGLDSSMSLFFTNNAASCMYQLQKQVLYFYLQNNQKFAKKRI